jgi:hypothetical protein
LWEGIKGRGKRGDFLTFPLDPKPELGNERKLSYL